MVIGSVLFLNLSYAQTLEWATQTGGDRSPNMVDMKMDSQENLYIAGNFSDTVDFDPGAGLSQLSTGALTGASYIQKLDSDGNFVWATRNLNDGVNVNLAFDIDQGDNLYVASNVYDATLYDIDPSPQVQVVQGNTQNNVIIQKIDQDGNLVWGISFVDSTESGRMTARDIAVDDDANIYLVGEYRDSIDFDPDLIGEHYLYNNVAFFGEQFILKLDSDGEFLWVRSFPQNDLELVAIATGNGAAYITGYFSGTIDLDASNPNASATSNSADADALTIKYSDQGDFEAMYAFGGMYNDRGFAIDVNEQGEVITSGRFVVGFDADNSPNVDSIYGHNSPDIYVQKLTSNCDYLWTKGFGSDGTDHVGDIHGDQNGNIVVTGEIGGGLDNNIDTLPSPGAFLMRLSDMGEKLGVKRVQIGDSRGLAIEMPDPNTLYSAGTFKSNLPDPFSLLAQEGFITTGNATNLYCLKLRADILSIPKESLNGNDITLFPNPTYDNFSFRHRTDEPVRVEIFSLLGGKVSSSIYHDDIIHISTELLPSGTYFVSIRNNQIRMTQKLIKL